MTLNEATRKGIGRLRRPEWSPYAHVEMYLSRVHAGQWVGNWGEPPQGDSQLFHGPWLRLYDPPSMLAMGQAWSTFQEVPSFGVDDADFEPWTPPADYERFATYAPVSQDSPAR